MLDWLLGLHAGLGWVLGYGAAELGLRAGSKRRVVAMVTPPLLPSGGEMGVTMAVLLLLPRREGQRPWSPLPYFPLEVKGSDNDHTPPLLKKRSSPFQEEKGRGHGHPFPTPL